MEISSERDIPGGVSPSRSRRFDRLDGDGRDGIMITGELKSKVDRIGTPCGPAASRTRSRSLSSSLPAFHQASDELHTREEHKAARTGHPIEKPVFTARHDDLRWSRFKELAPEQMFETVRDRVFPSSNRWARRRTRTRDQLTPIT